MAENKLGKEYILKQVTLETKRWDYNPSDQEIHETIKNVQDRGIIVHLVKNRKEALEKIKELIPKGAEVMNGSSTTLIEIGFVDYLKSENHGWNNFHESILSEKDPQKQGDLRRKADTSEYFLASVNAIAKTGELVAADASGSRVGAFPFTAKNLILVAGINKITNNLDEALQRLREYAYPLENVRAKEAYGMGSMIGKIVIMNKEMFKGRTTLILVKEKLGF